eukprot:PLAT6317.2.p2 GENE.PLAT6317.2~~PLAT6317.2.p2  ORF type:complete len:134 (+),score=17.16 PLAT6317.2:52-402(+)
MKFHPGEGVGMGRDHTIFAKKDGYVHFHNLRRIKRRWVSVVDDFPYRRPEQPAGYVPDGIKALRSRLEARAPKTRTVWRGNRLLLLGDGKPRRVGVTRKEFRLTKAGMPVEEQFYL